MRLPALSASYAVSSAVVLALALAAPSVRAQAPAQPAPQNGPQHGPEPQPTPWFTEPPADVPPAPPPPKDEGAFVTVAPGPSGPSAPPPPAPPPPIPPDPDDYDSSDDGLAMAVLGVRPFATYLGEGPRPSDPTSIVSGHVGIHLHGTGIEDDIIGRGDLSGFIGASSEGVEVEGRAFASLGLAKPLGGHRYVMFRFGAGGEVFGNPIVDFQVADLPALELGYVSTDEATIFEIAPRVAMGVLQMSAFQTGELEPDPAPAVGGRLLGGSDTLWGTLEYEYITGDKPLQIGALTACYAKKLALCVDGRLVSASLDFGGGTFQRVTAASAGFVIGVGEIEEK